MKRFFWLLFFINLGLLAYFNIGNLLPGKPEIKLTEINPDKIQLLSKTEIDALPKKTHLPTLSVTITPQPVAMCFEWGVFSDISLAKAQKKLANMSIKATVKAQNSDQPTRYWVYKPPLKTSAEAQKKAAEYKALGIMDIFVVQEDKWKNAISFGIFEDEQLAEKLVRELQAKGIKNVEKILRTNGKGQLSLLLGSISENEITRLKKLKPDFPTAELSEVTCNPG